MRNWPAVLLLLAPSPALAVEAHYAIYAGGVEVVDLEADFEVTAARYRVTLEYRTVGALNLVLRSQQKTVVEGSFSNTKPVPHRFFSTGYLRGAPRVTQLDFVSGQPVVRQLAPPNETEREPVSAAQMADTIDTLSAMADLIRQVNMTRRCEGRSMTFDGRRLSVLEARTSGEQPLEPSGRSSFAGPTLRCEFSGQQLAGFKHDEDRARQQRVQRGTAWFAAVTPGGPLLPVRIAFRTEWFGEATMYLAAKP